MSWVRLDDKFDENPKQLRMKDSAFRLYVCSLTYCARQDPVVGFLTFEQARGLVRKLGKRPSVIEALVQLRAWEEADGGYLIHDYEEYIEKGSRERTREWRSRKRHGDVTVTGYARDGYPVPVPVPYPPTPRPAGEGDVTVTYEGGRHDGLARIDRASLGTLLEKARANRESASAQESQQA